MANTASVAQKFFTLNPHCAVDTYCGLKIHAVPPRRDFTVLVLDILVNMPAGQNRSNCAFRNGFLCLATMPTAQCGFNEDETNEFPHHA
jgi:hypothetical protein